MKSKYIFLIVLLVMTSIAKGQQLKYNKVISYETKVEWSNPGDYISTLYIGQNESCFIFLGAQNAQENINDSNGRFFIKTETKYPEFFVNKYFNKHILFLGQVFDKYYLVKDSVQIKWKIYNERKKIGGYVCHKAIGRFRGRKYNVWFSNEIPVSLGPWKLSGLPGLIFEAVDSTRNVSFRLVSIKNKSGDLNIDIPKLKEITWEEYKKLFQKSWHHFFSYLRSYETESLMINISELHVLEPSIMENEK